MANRFFTDWFLWERMLFVCSAEPVIVVTQLTEVVEFRC